MFVFVLVEVFEIVTQNAVCIQPSVSLLICSFVHSFHWSSKPNQKQMSRLPTNHKKRDRRRDKEEEEEDEKTNNNKRNRRTEQAVATAMMEIDDPIQKMILSQVYTPVTTSSYFYTGLPRLRSGHNGPEQRIQLQLAADRRLQNAIFGVNGPNSPGYKILQSLGTQDAISLSQTGKAVNTVTQPKTRRMPELRTEKGREVSKQIERIDFRAYTYVTPMAMLMLLLAQTSQPVENTTTLKCHSLFFLILKLLVLTSHKNFTLGLF